VISEVVDSMLCIVWGKQCCRVLNVDIGGLREFESIAGNFPHRERDRSSYENTDESSVRILATSNASISKSLSLQTSMKSTHCRSQCDLNPPLDAVGSSWCLSLLDADVLL
jgi:hypothetical protein